MCSCRIFDAVASCLDAPSAAVRKFACFAVGNAAFHGPQTYPALLRAVPRLRSVLESDDPQTRANAAGAVGNLVRAGTLLLPLVLAERLPQKVEQIALDDGAIEVRRAAIFALGNLATHPAAAATLLPDLRMRLEADATVQGDAEAAAHTKRLAGKLAPNA